MSSQVYIVRDDKGGQDMTLGPQAWGEAFLFWSPSPFIDLIQTSRLETKLLEGFTHGQILHSNKELLEGGCPSHLMVSTISALHHRFRP